MSEIIVSKRDARRVFDRDAQRNRKRDAVLRVAAQSFNQKGFSNTSMDDVASALGVSKPTVYQYFKSKQELLYCCHQIAMDHGEEGIMLAHAHKGTGFEKLMVQVERYMRGVFGDLGTCPALTDVDSLDPERREEVIARRAKISAATANFILTGIEDNSIVDCNPKLASLFTLGALNWIPLWYREEGPNTPDEIIKSFMRFFKSGLSAQD